MPVLLLRKLRTVLLVRMRQDALAALEYGIASQVDRLTHCSLSHCYGDMRFFGTRRGAGGGGAARPADSVNTDLCATHCAARVGTSASITGL